MTYFPIGFHTGPGGTQRGIGDYFRQLDAAGRPAVLKAVDDYGVCRELAALGQASGVPHVIVFRKSGGPYELPDYNLPPDQAASEHWQLIYSNLPPEFLASDDKDIVWLEVINEPDKGRADWIGWFMYYTGQLAVAQGCRLCGPGWSTGEPEPEQWRTPGWAAYLQLCARQPNRLAIAVHEYSLTSHDILAGGGWLVGRYRHLFDVCDSQALARPYVLVTEFGWEATSLPADVDEAMRQLGQAAALYRDTPPVLGAAIWYLGGGYGGIANLAQPLIEPVKTTALSAAWDGHLPQRPKPPAPPGGCRGAPREQYVRVVQVLHPRLSDEQAVAAFRAGLALRRTTGWSFDDAGIGDLDDRTAEIVGCPPAEEHDYLDFFHTYYPGVKVVFVPAPGADG